MANKEERIRMIYEMSSVKPYGTMILDMLAHYGKAKLKEVTDAEIKRYYKSKQKQITSANTPNE